ncbi:MAG: hypothetical protein J7K39_00435 [Bacteroidales bacterium]|nr:hypothetical protein [Bacteroidales bacterium]RLD39347.1 MAG: hypothetical protein DRI74_00920 [Bacteroidota bacterium]
MSKEKKVHTGFRITKENLELLKFYEKNLGLNRTSVLELILTISGRDKKMMLSLLKKAIS